MKTFISPFFTCRWFPAEHSEGKAGYRAALLQDRGHSLDSVSSQSRSRHAALGMLSPPKSHSIPKLGKGSFWVLVLQKCLVNFFCVRVCFRKKITS